MILMLIDAIVKYLQQKRIDVVYNHCWKEFSIYHPSRKLAYLNFTLKQIMLDSVLYQNILDAADPQLFQKIDKIIHNAEIKFGITFDITVKT